MSEKDRRTRVAHVEDVDESGNVIEGTDRYAESVYAHSVASPSKGRETPNTGRTRRNKTRRDSISPGTSALTDSDSTLHPRGEPKRLSKDQERRFSRDKAMVPSHMRPLPIHANTAPAVPREATYYGISPTMTTSTSRPRTGRPPSMYGPSRPPAANAKWYQSQGPPPPPPPQQQPIMGSYPLPSWSAPSPYPIPPPSPAPIISQSPQDYFSSRPLEHRFGPGPRPVSSIGFRPPTRPIGFDDHPEGDDMLVRRQSHRQQSRHDDRRSSMAPPPRPSSARPGSLAIRPPPGTPVRRALGFDPDDFDGDSDLFRDISPRTQVPEYSAPISRTRSRSRRPSASVYDPGNFEIAVANARGGRRASYYGQSSSSGSFEDKLHQASLYQDTVTGSHGMQLTAESLRKAGRHGGSRASTRSSGSHDESDFRQSNTTRTTRSSAAEEDMTIRVKGNAILDLGGANLRCQDGTEINISRGPPAPTGLRTSSDKSSYMGEDRRARIDRPPTRHRASSQAASFSRSRPSHEPEYYAYEIPPPPPPYPEYPSVYPRPRDW